MTIPKTPLTSQKEARTRCLERTHYINDHTTRKQSLRVCCKSKRPPALCQAPAVPRLQAHKPMSECSHPFTYAERNFSQAFPDVYLPHCPHATCYASHPHTVQALTMIPTATAPQARSRDCASRPPLLPQPHQKETRARSREARDKLREEPQGPYLNIASVRVSMLKLPFQRFQVMFLPSFSRPTSHTDLSNEPPTTNQSLKSIERNSARIVWLEYLDEIVPLDCKSFTFGTQRAYKKSKRILAQLSQ